MKKIINKPYWSFVSVVMGIPAFFLIISENITENLVSGEWIIDSVKWILICGAFIFSLYAYHKPKDQNKLYRNVLQDIGKGRSDPQCALWDYGKYGYSCVPYNDTWKEWISSGNGKYGLVVTVNRPDLDYYNFGKEFYFVDLKINKKISIPTGDKARKEKVGSSFYDGMVVRLMPKNF